MADKETGLNITVGAVADKDSAGKAAKDIAKEVNNKIKGGRIEIDLDVARKPIKGLDKQKKEILDMWEEVSKKGGLLSAPKKDVDAFIKKYRDFSKLVGQSHKSNTSAYREMNRVIKEQIKLYKETYSEKNIKRAQDKWSNQSAAARKAKQEARTNSKEDDKFIKELAKGSSAAKSKVPGSRTNLGLAKQTPADKSIYTTQDSINKSESNPYQKGNATAEEKIRREEDIKTRKNTKIWNDKNYKLGTGEVEKGHIKIGPGAGRATTETEQAKLDVNNALNDLADIFKTLEKGVEEITDSEISTALNIARNALKLSGEDEEGAYNKISSKIQSLYDQSMKKRLGGTTGKAKGVGPGHENAVIVLERMNKALDDLWKTFKPAEAMAKRFARDMLEGAKSARTSTRTGSQWDQRKQALQGSNSETKNALSSMKKQVDGVVQNTGSLLAATKLNNAEEMLSSKKRNDILESDAASGANEDNAVDQIINEQKLTANATQSIQTTIEGLYQSLQSMFSKCPCEEILTQINANVETLISKGVTITLNREKKKKQQGSDIKTSLNQALSPLIVKDGRMVSTQVTDKTQRDPDKTYLPSPQEEAAQGARARYRRAIGEVFEAEQEAIEKNKNARASTIEGVNVKTSARNVLGVIEDIFEALSPGKSYVEKLMSKSAEEQAKIRAERIERYGTNNGRNATDTGVKTAFRYMQQLWSGNRRVDNNPNLAQDIRTTPAINIDTNKIMEGLNKALSGAQMFKAQTGGGTLRNILGYFTGYAGMPSLEKSRAEAEGLNQILSGVRGDMLALVQDIQAKQSALRGMEQRGTVQIDEKGRMVKGDAAAENLLATMEEEKSVLQAMISEVNMINEIVDSTGGNVHKIIKRMGFVMPELMNYNTILQNINAGLDKNGKALKFQKRTAEVLNYTFQLMSRYIGQMFKTWVSMLNPMNLIERAFRDFAGWNVKWQRTMNVIKYNIHAILEPFMDKVAQFLVNCIGMIDIISMKIQKAFGMMPISLFDQAAAEAQKLREELEAAANVTAGFDELHDIGSDNSGANDLMGDIYKPELSEGWKKFAEMLGDVFVSIGKAIQWCIDHWKLFVGLLTAFVIAKGLLKLFDLFAGLSKLLGSLPGLFGKIGSILSLGAFGKGIMAGLVGAFTGSGGLLATLKSIFVGHDAITAFSAWGETLGALFIQSLGVALGSAAVMKGFDIVADDASYNIGLKETGGKDEDKKSGFGGKALGAVGGAAIGAFLVGGPLAMGIGAIAGLIVTSLAPAFEELAVSSNKANNEMQKIEYYQGMVQGATTQVNQFTELQNLMAQAVENQTNKVRAQGDELGISTERMNALIDATKDGKFNTDMLSTSELSLADSLVQLSDLQGKNKEATEKLTEAKKKLQKAEMDLAIAQDIEAGNFELAAARVEVALASQVIEAQEAGQKMAMIAKQTGNDMRAEMLKDMSPELRKGFEKYVDTTEQGKRDLVNIYSQLSDEERKVFSKSYENEMGSSMKKTLDAAQKVINNTTWDWSHPFKSLWSVFSGDWSWKGQVSNLQVPKYATGTNYVPSDGLAYLHQGEAVIPKKYNQPYQPNNNSGLESAINQLASQVAQISSKVDQGINVRGQFVQRGSDLVATVEKANNKLSNNILNNRVYAR